MDHSGDHSRMSAPRNQPQLRQPLQILPPAYSARPRQHTALVRICCSPLAPSSKTQSTVELKRIQDPAANFAHLCSIHDREREAELQLWKELYRNWQVTGLILYVDVFERRPTSTIPRPLSRTVSEDDVRRYNIDDRSVGAVAVKPRALGAPLCGIGA